MVTRSYMLGSKVDTKSSTELGEDELSTTVKPHHAPRRGSAFASPSNGSDATSPASIIVRAYESWADDENQCLVVTSTFASRKGGNENSPFGASTKSVVVPVWERRRDAARHLHTKVKFKVNEDAESAPDALSGEWKVSSM